MRKLILIFLAIALASPAWAELPYAKAGLSREEAAAHLLSRFSYGARPGEVEKVSAMGLERWFEEQLEARQGEPELNSRLQKLRSQKLSQYELLTEYPPPGMLVRRAKNEGHELPDREDRKAFRRALMSYGARSPFARAASAVRSARRT